MTRRVRLESFGAWVRLDDATLVAIDRGAARRLGLDGGDFWKIQSVQIPARPLEVHLAVTSRCPLKCEGCYQSASAGGEHVARAAIERALRELGESGVFTVAFGGGEPLTRDDLGELATVARSHGLVPVVTVSGVGLTEERAKSLRDFAQVNVSHDGPGEGYSAVRGFDGKSLADKAISILVSAGVTVGVNHVLTRHNFDGLGEMCAHAERLGASELQLLRYKPAGRAATIEYLDRRLTRAQVECLASGLESLSQKHSALSLRVDCAMVPLLSGVIGDADLLARFGVFGCEAGRHLGAIDAQGRRQGCSFDTSARAPEVLSAWAVSPPEPCASCGLREVCRGGCRVVSEHLTGALGPDPECPRVLAWRARAKGSGC